MVNCIWRGIIEFEFVFWSGLIGLEDLIGLADLILGHTG